MSIILSGNRLGSEKSPYLLQHKDNPVWWWPWCDGAFEAARREDKPVFLSIGYATCYWCHVMEQDSFEQQDVAELLNQHFVSVKLDREERPDIDAVYMDAVVGMTGQGGWPMSVFLSPDRTPFWGGTFFYRAQFMQILERLNQLWGSDRERILRSADQIGAFLRRRERHDRDRPILSTRELQQQAFLRLKEQFDPQFGGFGAAPKFPPTGQVEFLMRSPESEASDMVNSTLSGMAKGGFFDQIGGGFSRYSTDARWLVPHFEKMLYDNALLARCCLNGWRYSGDASFRDVAVETLDFVLRELALESGGFASALDAGAVGQEGEYYVWAYRDLKPLLTEDEFNCFVTAYGVTPEGNFEAKYTVLALGENMPLQQRRDPLLRSAREKLLAVRNSRVRPLCDDKLLTAWNGLMISALADGWAFTQDQKYRSAAVQTLQFLWSRMVNPAGVLRRYRDGDAAIAGCLEDYAYLIGGVIDYALATAEYEWIPKACELQLLQDQLFFRDDAGAYCSSIGEDLIVRKYELSDGALPSPNAQSFANLHRLSVLTGDTSLAARAGVLGETLSREASSFSAGFCRFLAAAHDSERSAQLVIVVPQGRSLPADLLMEWRRLYIPELMILVHYEGAEPPIALLRDKPAVNGQITGYLCRNQSCLPASSDIDRLLHQVFPVIPAS